MLPFCILPLLSTTGIACSLLLNVRLGLIGSGLLFLQSLICSLIRFRRRNIACRGGGIGSLRQAAGPLLFREFAHAVLELFAEVVVHFLQIVDRDRALTAHFAIPLLA